MRPKKITRKFFERNAETVARELLGKILVHKAKNKTYRCRIVETEAYVGTHDLACHASRGRTSRTEIMFGEAGFAYVYLIYGVYDMLNIVVSQKDDAQAVLIRAAEDLSNENLDLSGPGKLTKNLKITRKNCGEDFCGSKLFFYDASAPRSIKKSPRIGVDYAKEWKDKHLRFFDAMSSAVSQRSKFL